MHNPVKTFSLTSSRGWERLTFQLIDRAHVQGTEHLKLSIQMSAKTWDGLQNVEDSSLVDDCHLEIKQAILKTDELKRLENLLAGWLSSSAECSCALGGAGYPHVSIVIGVRSDIISSKEKPVVELKYDTASVNISWKMLVDYSCIKLFKDELNLFLAD